LKRKVRKEKASQKKKALAFKSYPFISDDDEDELEDDEELSLLMKNVRRMYHKAKFNNRRRWRGNEERKIVCHNCRKLGHIIADAWKRRANPLPPRSPTRRKP